jgi:cytochrome c oxidase subunit 4
MEHEGTEDIRKHVRVYITVFVALAALTIITVGISYLHLPTHLAIILALIVASVKGTLVACYFMHLVSERRVIYWVLLIAFAFFVVLMMLPTFTSHM